MSTRRKKRVDEMLSKLKKYSNELATKCKLYGVGVSIYHECARDIPNHNRCMIFVTPACKTNTDGIVEEVKGTIYISNEEIYRIILDCNMDYDKALYCISYIFTSAYGYVVYLHNTFVNKPVREFKDCRDIHDRIISNYNSTFPHEPTYAEHFDWFVGKCNITPWKEIMESVGLTRNDCIKCFEYLYAEDKENES